jgi:hypothetical protein
MLAGLETRMSVDAVSNNNSICYQGVQRIFRNAVVDLIRSHMTDAFGPQAVEKLKAPFQKEWARIAHDAQASRASGDLGASIIDDFDFLGVNHFYNLFEAYYKILLPQTTQVASTAVSKPTLLGYLKAIKDLRDPLCHPSEREFSFDDAHHLLNCARLILGYLRKSQDAVQLQQLMRQLTDIPLARLNPKNC